MKHLIIIGAGGHGRVVADLALTLGTYDRVSFFDDRFNGPSGFDPAFPGVKLVGTVSDAESLIPDCECIVAIGNNDVRSRLTKELISKGMAMATLVHPAAVIGSQVTLGKGTVIMAGAVVQTGTIIGDGCIINTGATIDHDGHIGDFCHISVGAHLAGVVAIGAKTFVCASACVINNTYICGDCILGAGSITIRDITEPGTYVGVPSRKIHD